MLRLFLFLALLASCGKREGLPPIKKSAGDKAPEVLRRPDAAPEPLDAPLDAPVEGSDSGRRDEPEPDSPLPEEKESWVRYEPDSDFHNIFDGVFWRIHQGFVEVKGASRPAGSLTLVDQCLQTFGPSLEKWSAALQIKIVHLYATAVTESGCTSLSGSSDGLSSGLMQATTRTCVAVMDKIGKKMSGAACTSEMANNPDFSVEVAARYMMDEYQLKFTGFTPVSGTASGLGPALDPPKVTAGYNAGALKKTTANRWHLHVTGDHIERYLNAYNAFVEYTKNKQRGFLPVSTHKMQLAPNPALPVAVNSIDKLAEYSNKALEGNSIFVGDWKTKTGDFYYWIKGSWRSSTSRW